MPDFKQVTDIARASLMPDFFAVRIDEEGLYEDLKTMLNKLKLPTPLPALGRLRDAANVSADANAFIEEVKKTNDFTTLRDLLVKVRIG